MLSVEKAIREQDISEERKAESAIDFITNEAGEIHVWMNIIGGFDMGNHIEEGHDIWNYMYNTNLETE